MKQAVSISHPSANPTALLLAEKHEQNPSVLKMSQFNETVDLLKSASAWNKFSIKRFGVDFERTTYTKLNTLIKDPKWYLPETELMTEDFTSRTCQCYIADVRVLSNYTGISRRVNRRVAESEIG